MMIDGRGWWGLGRSRTWVSQIPVLLRLSMERPGLGVHQAGRGEGAQPVCECVCAGRGRPGGVLGEGCTAGRHSHLADNGNSKVVKWLKGKG